MKPFRAPLEGILFSLVHVAGAGRLGTFDPGTAGEIGAHFAAFAEAELAPPNGPGDREGCRLADGRVRTPAGFRKAYAKYVAQGWPGMCAPRDLGGQGIAPVYQAITSEIFTGANHSLQMLTALVPGAVRVLEAFGTGGQQARHIPRLASGAALATMCLSEPGAGSDLSRITCRARPGVSGWRLDGEKIFISGGDQDLSEEILHLVLARTSDGGIAGLSLFLCPSVLPDGSRNSVSVARIERKMGLHASPTCHMIFDGARAELVGGEGRGLAAMFTMMNHARVDVALQGAAHAARTSDIASAHAAGRVQGRGAGGQPVTLAGHADVRRMLDQIDGLALSARAIAHLVLVALECPKNGDLAEFLTPVAKVACTDAGIRAADIGIQVLGGYGYLHDYGIEQTYRDARVTAIYEGANGIHERALATRLARGPAGDAFARFLAQEAEAGGNNGLRAAASVWADAREALAGASDPSERAHDFTAGTAEALLACVWARIAAVADHHPDPARIRRLCVRAGA